MKLNKDFPHKIYLDKRVLVNGIKRNTINYENNIELAQWIQDLIDNGDLIIPQNQLSLSVVDTTSIDFTTSSIANHTLTGTVKISTNVDNQLSITPTGLFVPIQNNQINISTDLNNCLILGTDGGVYFDCSLNGNLNIYNGNGTLTSDRILNGNQKKLRFGNLGEFFVNVDSNSCASSGQIGLSAFGCVNNSSAMEIAGSNNGEQSSGTQISGISTNTDISKANTGIFLNGVTYCGINFNINTNSAGILILGENRTPAGIGEGCDVLIKGNSGRIAISGLPVYNNDGAAGVGGLLSNMLYKTATGEIRIKI